MLAPRGRARPSRIGQLNNRAAIGQGTRTAIVAFGGFALGYWVLHGLQIAVFATFGGLALTGIANFGGTRPGRFTANTLAGLAGVGLASPGTWASSQAVAVAAGATFGVGLLTVLVGLFGGYFAVASSATILYYLVAVGSPVPVAVIPDRAYGVLIGGALAAVASVALWPEAVELPVQRAALYLLNDLERLDRLLTAAASTPLPPADLRALNQAGRQLRQAAAILAGRPEPGLAAPGHDQEGGAEAHAL